MTWHYIFAQVSHRLLKYQRLTAHTHPATVEDQSGSVADRRVRKKVFRVWAYLTVMWCAPWIFVFSYGLPTGDQATALQLIAIPPAMLLFVLIIGLRRAVNGRLKSAPLHSAE